jgi:enoyl-CoA hydratase/carnithine racemase
MATADADAATEAAAGNVRVERGGTVATIWLDRPHKRNAMTYRMWRQMRDICLALAGDAEVRVVIVRGAGDHFCAGADISELHVARPSGEPSFMDMNMEAESALAELPQPTVALIAGDCIGGGCAIAIDCDLRIATADARFGITPARLGVVYPVASIERLVGLLGPAAAKQLLFTGDLIDAAHAQRLGLVGEVLNGTATAAQRVDQLASDMAARSALTQAAAKSMIAAVLREGAVSPDLVAHWIAEAAKSGDSVEGAAAFAERRLPRFSWRPGT